MSKLIGEINWLRDLVNRARAKVDGQDPVAEAELTAFLSEAPLDVDANLPSEPSAPVEHMDQRRPAEPAPDERERLAAYADRRREIAARCEGLLA